MKIKYWISAFLAGWLLCWSIAPGAARAEENKQTPPPAEEQSAQEAEGPRAEDRSLALGESSVSYPAVTGISDQALQEKINNQILEDLGVTGYLARMSQLISGGSLKVSWQGQIFGDVFSCASSAEGAVINSRSTFVWTGSSVDLTDGHEIGFSEFFTDEAAAREGIESWIDENVAPEMSAYLISGNVTPLPDLYYITPRGLVMLYAIDQWRTLSDRAGALLLGWNEMQPWLDLSEGSIASRLGVPEMLEITEKTPAALQLITSEGAVPGLPVQLGGSIKEAVDTHHLLIDPDIYEEGRMFSLEGACFRSVFLLTDYLSEEWDNSLIRGIRIDCGCLAGLRIGQSKKEEWREALGEPENTVSLDEEKAEAYRTVPGERDYYAWGGHRLVLHSDEEGTLRSIILSE